MEFSKVTSGIPVVYCLLAVYIRAVAVSASAADKVEFYVAGMVRVKINVPCSEIHEERRTSANAFTQG